MAESAASEAEPNVKERKIYDFPGKAKSAVWMRFGFYKDGDKLDMTKVICKLCKRVYSNNGKLKCER